VLIALILIKLMMVAKTNMLALYVAHAVGDMIQMHKKLRLLNEVNIYLATQRRATTILAFDVQKVIRKQCGFFFKTPGE
jgi:hypothetical protein